MSMPEMPRFICDGFVDPSFSPSMFPLILFAGAGVPPHFSAMRNTAPVLSSLLPLPPHHQCARSLLLSLCGVFCCLSVPLILYLPACPSSKLPRKNPALSIIYTHTRTLHLHTGDSHPLYSSIFFPVIPVADNTHSRHRQNTDSAQRTFPWPRMPEAR